MAPRSLQQRSDDIDLRSVWQAVVGSLGRLAVLSLVLGGVTFGMLKMVASRYVSETQLAIESKSTANPFADPTRGSTSDGLSFRMDKEAINTHVRALMSTDLAETIVREMSLAELPEFNSARGSPDALSGILRRLGIGAPRAAETDQDRALDAYFDRLEVYSPKESRFIGVRFTSIDPDLAAAVANRIAETYRANLARQSLAETDEVQKALEPKIATLAEEAARAEAEVEKFRGEANIFKGGQQATGLNEQQLAELNAELSKVKAARSEAEARAKQAREMQAIGSAEALADVQKSPLIQSLVQSRVRVERQISELSATLLSGHPRMRQLNADLAGLKSQIAGEVAKIVDGIGKEAKVAAMREEAVQKSVNEIKSRIVSSGPEEARLRSLEADARSKRTELDRLRAQYEANRIRADDSRTIPVEAQVVSGARPSTVPFFPKRGPTALLVVIASFLIGLALVVTKALLGESPVVRMGRKGPESRREIAAPILPQPLHRAGPPSPRQPIPEVEKAPPPAAVAVPVLAARQGDAVPAMPAAIAAASVAALAQGVEGLRKASPSGVRTIFVGASDASVLAAEASAFAQSLSEKGLTVILVDWAPDGAGMARHLGVASAPGFGELLDGTARFEDVVVALRDSDIHVIPCGSPIPREAGALDGDSINFILDALDDVYEHIVVVGRAEPATHLFEAMQGRFDAGVTLVEDRAQKARLAGEAGMFLGFEVDGISLFTLERKPEPSRVRQMLARSA